jgi:hypothetical protein
VTYVLVEKGDTMAYNCMDNCIYEDKEDLGSRFCFKTGERPVTYIRDYGRISCENLFIITKSFQDASVGSRKTAALLVARRLR